MSLIDFKFSCGISVINVKFYSYTAEVDPPDCVIKVLARENATKNSMPSTLSSTDTKDKVSLISIVAIEMVFC